MKTVRVEAVLARHCALLSLSLSLSLPAVRPGAVTSTESPLLCATDAVAV